MTPGETLRGLLAAGEPLVAPGVFDGLSARLVEAAGFRAVYASGSAMARSAGYPDIGILDMTEVIDRLAKIVDVTAIPVIADADTGFGGLANAQRTARMMRRIGVAAFHVEDQTFPKRCGALAGKGVVPAEEMCRKVEVMRAELGSDTLLIARTDAIAVEGIDAAIGRARAYAAAGADIVYVLGPETIPDLRRIGREVPGVKLIDMFPGCITPLVGVDELFRIGIQIVILPNDLQRAVIRTIQDTLRVIKAQGNTDGLQDRMASMTEREEVVRTADYLSLGERGG